MLDQLVAIAERQAWTADALCAEKAHLFFAPPGERRTRRAKRERSPGPTATAAACSVPADPGLEKTVNTDFGVARVKKHAPPWDTLHIVPRVGPSRRWVGTLLVLPKSERS